MTPRSGPPWRTRWPGSPGARCRPRSADGPKLSVGAVRGSRAVRAAGRRRCPGPRRVFRQRSAAPPDGCASASQRVEHMLYLQGQRRGAAVPPLARRPTQGCAHSVPIRPDNHGKQRCETSPTNCTSGSVSAGQKPFGSPSAVASQADGRAGRPFRRWSTAQASSAADPLDAGTVLVAATYVCLASRSWRRVCRAGLPSAVAGFASTGLGVAFVVPTAIGVAGQQPGSSPPRACPSSLRVSCATGAVLPVGRAAAGTVSAVPAGCPRSFSSGQWSAQHGVGSGTSNGTSVPPAAGIAARTSCPSRHSGRT